MSDNGVLNRIAALERELRELKQRAISGEARLSSAGLEQQLQDLDEETSPSLAKGRTAAERAEKLFSWLLEKRKLVSYARAYELIFEQAPSPFRNAVHVPRLLEVALRTAPRRHGDLEVRLDSFIVSIRGRQPGPGHFRTAPYTLDDWTRALGSWVLLR